MQKIIGVHFHQIEETLVDQAMATFYWIRSLPEIEKKPGTSELIDWLRALQIGGVPVEELAARSGCEIPLAGVLLKKDKDLGVLEKHRERR